MKAHKSPRSAKKERKLKKTLPRPGDGVYNKIYTTETADGSEIVIVMHKQKANTFAFTKNIDDMMRSNPNVRESFGFDNLFLRVHEDNGNDVYAVEYTNQRNEKKVKHATVYHRKPGGETSKAKREKWARNVLVRQFNKYGSAQYARQDWQQEKFEYGGDLASDKWTNYLPDFITFQSVASIMREDFGYGEKPLTCDDMANNRELVEMYFGPDKVDEGVKALKSLSEVKFSTASDEEKDSEDRPYESDEDVDDDEVHEEGESES